MASLIYLDTHVVAWLYAEGGAALPSASAQIIETTQDIRISPMVRMELQYLYEIQRVTQPPLTVLDDLTTALGLSICNAPFAAVVRAAEQQSWTRDPFDRLIVAQAALHDAVLLTKDSRIQAHYQKAFWD